MEQGRSRDLCQNWYLQRPACILVAPHEASSNIRERWRRQVNARPRVGGDHRVAPSSSRQTQVSGGGRRSPIRGISSSAYRSHWRRRVDHRRFWVHQVGVGALRGRRYVDPCRSIFAHAFSLGNKTPRKRSICHFRRLARKKSYHQQFHSKLPGTLALSQPPYAKIQVVRFRSGTTEKSFPFAFPARVEAFSRNHQAGSRLCTEPWRARLRRAAD
jgi:hypothetical protein